MKLRIVEWCEHRGIESLADLSRRAGVRRATISSIVNGHTIPHRSTVKALARALRTSEAKLARRPPKD